MASLEEKIDALTAAVKENTEELRKQGGGSSSASTGTKAADKPKADKPKAGAKSKFTAEQVKAAVLEVREKKDRDTAATLIEKHAGKGKKLADLTAMPEKFDAVMAECESMLNASEDDDDVVSDDDDDI